MARLTPPVLFKYALGIISFSTMTYFITICMRQYLSYPTQTRVLIRLNRSQSFPGVTICSGNPVRLDKYLVPLLGYIITHNLTASPTNISRDEIYYGAYYFMIDLFNNNRTDEMLSYGFQLNDVLINCTYNGYECQSMWTTSISPIYGNCFTFNQKTTLPRRNPMFAIGDVNAQTITLDYGLQLIFYVNMELYFPMVTYGIGLTGLIHNNDEQPLVRYTGQRFAPGLEHVLVYRREVSNYLGAPYTTCTREIRADMRALYKLFDDKTEYVYSETVCIELCQQTYMYEQCGCTTPVYFFLNQLIIDGQLRWVPVCVPWSLAYGCALKARQQIANNAALQASRCPHCLSQCEINSFSNELSALKGPSDAEIAEHNQTILYNSTIPVLPDFAQNASYYLNRNYLKLSVICSSPYVTTYQEQATYTWAALISDLGGQSGLWMGVSVLSLFELVEYLYKKQKIIGSKKETQVQAFEETSPSSQVESVKH